MRIIVNAQDILSIEKIAKVNIACDLVEDNHIHVNLFRIWML